MKVYLGPYPQSNWWTDLFHFLHIPYQRKTKVKLDYYDHWNAGDTIARVALPIIKVLKEKSLGYTEDIDNEDLPEELQLDPVVFEKYLKEPWNREKFEISDEFMVKRWKWVLDEIIWTMTNFLDESSEDQYYTGEHGELSFESDPERPGLSSLEIKEHPTNPLTVDREGLDKHWKRIKKGFQLFGKYYLSFWD